MKLVGNSITLHKEDDLQSVSHGSQSPVLTESASETSEAIQNNTLHYYSDKDNNYLRAQLHDTAAGRITYQHCVKEAAERLGRKRVTMHRKLNRLAKSKATKKSPTNKKITVENNRKTRPYAYTDKENSIMQKAWVAIQSGKSTILESSKSLAKIMHRSPKSLYNKLFRIGRAQEKNFSVQQLHKALHPTKHRSHEQESGSSSERDYTDGSASNSGDSRNKKTRCMGVGQRHAYTPTENELILRCANSILEGTTTLKQVVRTLAVQMGVSESAITNKLCRIGM